MTQIQFTQMGSRHFSWFYVNTQKMKTGQMIKQSNDRMIDAIVCVYVTRFVCHLYMPHWIWWFELFLNASKTLQNDIFTGDRLKQCNLFTDWCKLTQTVWFVMRSLDHFVDCVCVCIMHFFFSFKSHSRKCESVVFCFLWCSR